MLAVITCVLLTLMKCFAHIHVLLPRLRSPVGKMTAKEQRLEGELRYVSSRITTNGLVTKGQVYNSVYHSSSSLLNVVLLEYTVHRSVHISVLGVSLVMLGNTSIVIMYKTSLPLLQEGLFSKPTGVQL